MDEPLKKMNSDQTAEQRARRTAYVSEWRKNNKEKVAEYVRNWRRKNPEWCAEYRAKNKEKRAAANKRWREKYPERASKHWKKCSVKKRFGITVEQYDALLRAQGGACHICGEVKSKMDLDHNHKTGKLRKFLCSPCNLLVGNIESNRDRLQAVLNYLEEHS